MGITVAGRNVFTPERMPVVRLGVWAGCVLSVPALLPIYIRTAGVDSHAYWSAWRHGLYSVPAGYRDAYLYSPAFAQVFWPLTHLPWVVSATAWSLVIAAVFAWLLAPLGWQWAVPLWLLCVIEMCAGNVYAFFALVLAVGLSRPGAWAFPLLLKITPAVGVVWFGVRREWRRLALAGGLAAAVALVSFAFAPNLWVQWIRLLVATSGEAGHAIGASQPGVPPFVYRLPVAVALTAWGARTGRRWVLAPAMILASPVIGGATFTVLAGLPRLTGGFRAASTTRRLGTREGAREPVK